MTGPRISNRGWWRPRGAWAKARGNRATTFASTTTRIRTMDSSWTRAMAAEFGTSATWWTRASWNLCGWEFGRRAIRSFDTRWRSWMARFAWRRRTGRRFTDTAMTVMAKRILADHGRGKASGAPGRYLPGSAASMRLPQGTMRRRI